MFRVLEAANEGYWFSLSLSLEAWSWRGKDAEKRWGKMRSSPESKEDEITRSQTKTDPLWKIGRDVRSLGSIGLVFCSMDILCNFGLWSLIRKSESERSEKTLSYFQFALESEFEREKRLFVLLWREKPTLNPGRATRSQFQMRSWPTRSDKLILQWRLF